MSNNNSTDSVFPNIIMVESVGICTGKCNYCPQGRGLLSKPKKNKIFITPTTLKRALEVARNGKQKAIYIHHRGEPLLHPHIGDVIHNIRLAGYFVYMSTNLTVATEEKMREILNAGINQIELHISGGLTKINMNEILKKIHLLRKLNWKIRNNGCYIESNYALKEGESQEDVIKTMEKSPYFEDNMYIRFYHPHDWPALVKLKNKGINPKMCKWYKTKCAAILCDGDVVICCFVEPDYFFST